MIKKAFIWMGVILLFSSCKQTPFAPNTPLNLDETMKVEILKSIQEESDLFYDRDFERWSAKFEESSVSWTCVEEKGFILQAYTKKDLDKLVGDYMKENPTPETVTIKRENFVFISDVNAVWVNFDEYQTVEDKTKVLKGVRLMKKLDNQWIISGMHSSFVKYEQRQNPISK